MWPTLLATAFAAATVNSTNTIAHRRCHTPCIHLAVSVLRVLSVGFIICDGTTVQTWCRDARHALIATRTSKLTQEGPPTTICSTTTMATVSTRMLSLP